MRKRLVYGLGTLLLAVLVALVVWQTSFSFGDFGPASPEQTYSFWAVSTLIFILTVTLGFMLARNFVKLYVDRHSNREGSRIRTKLVIGALILTFTPVVFLVVFSTSVLNRTIDKWFSRPAENIRWNLIAVGVMIDQQAQAKAAAYVDWIAELPQTGRARNGDTGAQWSLQRACEERRILLATVEHPSGVITLCRVQDEAPRPIEARRDGIRVVTTLPVDLARKQLEVDQAVKAYNRLKTDRDNMRSLYIQLLALITLFILFVATWAALFMAKQISVPIVALLGAAQEIRRGNLGCRVRVKAMDEFATFVRVFNEMTQELEANSRELEKRRRFTEAILESIPTGVISVSADGRIQTVNRALKGLFSADQVDRASHLRDLFSTEDMAEIRYLMNRARRTGVAASQLEVRRDRAILQLSVTIAALEDKINPGFVIVLEDTSDMLRAQKAAAWREIARRIAHEIKNPLTPIALCAERIARQLDRTSTETPRILRQCSQIISSEVETVRTLVDEFTQFARFPAAQPAPSDLNEVVENALGVFAGRLDGIQVTKDLSPDLPPVNIDREQFKRAVVNLIDNAAEAMHDSLVRRLHISTEAIGGAAVELTVADTGHGISPEDKEKLFIPYFTTKTRGTGLGLAIVNHIVSEHGAQIRVEDNTPTGVRFTIELTAITAPEPEPQSAEVQA
jgi:PAS domain S-box-containing protein